jgi:hypothetical protein
VTLPRNETGLSPQSIPVGERLAAPTPTQVRMARERAGLTQTEAALLVPSGGASGAKAHRTWQNYEAPLESPSHRRIGLATWELFLLRTNQHPYLILSPRQGR